MTRHTLDRWAGPRPLSMIPALEDMTPDECRYYANRTCRTCDGMGVAKDGDVCPDCIGKRWEEANDEPQ